MKEISGDFTATYQLSTRQKIWYLVYNFLRGLRGLFSLVPSRHWVCTGVLPTTPRDASPMRTLVEAALVEFLTATLHQSKSIRVLDIGCGRAKLRRTMAELGYSGTYTGIDVFREPAYVDDADPAFPSRIHVMPVESFHTEDRYDLVMSVTTLEHVADDFAAVVVAREHMAEGGVQIHVVPGFWSLFMYLWHGYRQYTRHRLGKLFLGQNYTMYRVGGAASFLLHVLFITLPEVVLCTGSVRNRSWYTSLRNAAIKADRYLPFFPNSYIVVIR
jgi:SAM-dependent methyltransferase